MYVKSKCTQMLRILGREVADVRTSGTFFKAVIQAILLFGSETWVVNPHVGFKPGGLTHEVILSFESH